jgi:hypothetical protein
MWHTSIIKMWYYLYFFYLSSTNLKINYPMINKKYCSQRSNCPADSNSASHWQISNSRGRRTAIRHGGHASGSSRSHISDTVPNPDAVGTVLPWRPVCPAVAEEGGREEQCVICVVVCFHRRRTVKLDAPRVKLIKVSSKYTSIRWPEARMLQYFYTDLVESTLKFML